MTKKEIEPYVNTWCEIDDIEESFIAKLEDFVDPDNKWETDISSEYMITYLGNSSSFWAQDHLYFPSIIHIRKLSSREILIYKLENGL